MRAPSWLPMPARRTLRVVRRWWRASVGHGRRLSAPARRAWRRSLQLRVVTITLLASSLLVGTFGVFVATQSANILLSRAQDEVENRLRGKVTFATENLSVYPQTADPKLPAAIAATVDYVAESDPGNPTAAIVSLRAEQLDDFEPVTQPFNLDTAALDALITPEMVRLVAGLGQDGRQIRTADLGQGQQKYLVFGSPVPTRFGQVELYYMVALTNEDRAANQIRTTVLVTGLALVILLGVVAGLVTRLVVTPVRVAARTAQRLSAGLLDQRMKVDGEDDLALLAASFNQMAGNLQKQIVRLEDMSRLQRRFTSDVSHELRTPLTTVRMAADLIFAERDEFDPAVARSAELLQAELNRFEDLLTDLLEISRFDAGFAALDAEPTDLVPVVHRVAERLAGLAERAGLIIELHLPDAPVIAEVDPRRVERVLRNLVGNAVEHGEGQPVHVTLAHDEAAVAVTVRDHGVGLKPGEEQLVFNRFWRADPSRARQTGGTGLGLSISVEDARLHGGWLEAWGVPGGGAQFRLTLPVRAGERLVTAPLPLIPEDIVVPGGDDADSAGPDPVRDPIDSRPTARAIGPDEVVPNRAGRDLADPDLADPDLADPDLADPDLAGPEPAGPDLAAVAGRPDPAEVGR